MRIALISTEPDLASKNIRTHLLASLPWQPCDASGGDIPVLTAQHSGHTLTLHHYHAHSITLEHMDEKLNTDIIVFCSKHASKSGIPSLSVHPIGNFTTAEYGGSDKTLCPCPAELMYHCFHALIAAKKRHDLHHEVVYEATHHGPILETPTMFIEIGSDEKEWVVPKSGQALAEALLEGIAALGTPVPDPIIGFGGLHTCPNFNKVVERRQALLGHVCPVYMLEHLDEELVQQMVEKTVPSPHIAVLDWKGLKSWKQKTSDLLDASGLDVRRTKDFKEEE